MRWFRIAVLLLALVFAANAAAALHEGPFLICGRMLFHIFSEFLIVLVASCHSECLISYRRARCRRSKYSTRQSAVSAHEVY
jgi:hypothetical protein